MENKILDLFLYTKKLKFSEIERSLKERSNYVLLKVARIVAMTVSHAAIRRDDLLQLGFQFDTIIIDLFQTMLRCQNPIIKISRKCSTNVRSMVLYGQSICFSI